MHQLYSKNVHVKIPVNVFRIIVTLTERETSHVPVQRNIMVHCVNLMLTNVLCPNLVLMEHVRTNNLAFYARVWQDILALFVKLR